MNNIQDLVFPSLGSDVDEALFFRRQDSCSYIRCSPGHIMFTKGAAVTSDTFYNGFSIGIWRRYTNVEDLYLSLSGQGRFILRVGRHSIGHPHAWLLEESIELTAGQDFVARVPDFEGLDRSILYFSLYSLGDGVLHGGYYGTRAEPLREVKLGLVITHFNRKKYVLPAIRKIVDSVTATQRFRDNITLTVVDNSRNINESEAAGASLISNENYGGAGGFTRGLLHLIDTGHTHCLFMDDDASCLPGSIQRTYSLLSHAETDRFALAGAMLDDCFTTKLFEKGARFDGFCRPIKSGLDLSVISDLLEAEYHEEVPDYGGWWYFAFKISDVREYPFPFFVRGDDSRFSIANEFSVCSLNGVASWAPSFSAKASAMNLYLDARYHILHNISLLRLGGRGCLKNVFRLFVDQLYSYNYGSARAIRLGLEHVIQGPSFFKENLDTSAIRAEISGFSASEKMISHTELGKFVVRGPRSSEGVIRRFIRIYTLNGFLLPKCIFKSRVLVLPKSYRGSFRSLFMAKSVLYEDSVSMRGYVAHHSKLKFYTEFLVFLKCYILFIARFKRIREQYDEFSVELEGQDFWRNVYNLNSVSK